MDLHQYLGTYLAERPGLSVGYCRLMAATVRKLYAWVGRAGRPLVLAEVNRAMLSGWARHLLETDRPATVNNKLRMIRSLLLAAYDDGVLDHASPELTRRRYVDPRIARQRSAADVLPDPLPGKPALRVFG